MKTFRDMVVERKNQDIELHAAVIHSNKLFQEALVKLYSEADRQLASLPAGVDWLYLDVRVDRDKDTGRLQLIGEWKVRE
jgi:hypothetical protein